MIMQIEIDTSKVGNSIKNYILHNMKMNYDIHESNDVITIMTNVPIGDIKIKLVEILSPHLDEYIVVENYDNKNQLVVLKNGDIEQLGLYACIHCGMMFKSDEERYQHSSIHYFM